MREKIENIIFVSLQVKWTRIDTKLKCKLNGTEADNKEFVKSHVHQNSLVWVRARCSPGLSMYFLYLGNGHFSNL